MAVKLRLRRMGKKKQPFYRIVAADSRSPRNGRFIEAIGTYNPLTDPHTVDIKEERALYWLDVGAIPTDTVKSLLKQKGITLKRHLNRKGLSDEQIEAELGNWKKMVEAREKSKSQKKSSKKKKSSAENTEPDQTEKQAQQQQDLENSTSEVKGAASEEEPAKES
ncbi:MAG: hypothetical protein Kow0098_10820 [Ignavibacteriaceae bacterium]